MLNEVLAPFPAQHLSALSSMYGNEPQRGIDGDAHAIDETTRISPVQARMLFELCRNTRSGRVVEIGMAYGFSTLAFLAAIKAKGFGHLTSIDPFQRSQWHGIGLQHVASLAAADPAVQSQFRHLDSRSDRAAMHLADLGEKFDLVYIDGMHTFDYALVDFFLFEQVTEAGGLIVLDDMWMPSIRKVKAFIVNNFASVHEIETPVANLCVLQKNGSDRRRWDHFVDF